MSGLQLFDDPTIFTLTMISLAIFAFSSIYNASGIKYRLGIYLLFAGLTLDFIASWFGFEMNFMSSTSLDVSIFIEMSLILASMAFLIFAALQFLVIKLPNLFLGLCIILIGLSANVYFIFLNPDGDMINNMRHIFPIAGLTCVAISFWSQTSSRRLGSLLAALATSAIAFLLILNVAGVNLSSARPFFSLTLFLFLAISLFMINADSVVMKLNENNEKIKGYNKRIEDIIRLSPFPIIISRLSDDKIMLANVNALKLFSIPVNDIDRFKLRDLFAEPDARHALTENLEQNKEVQDFEILVKPPFGDTPFWVLTSANVIDYNNNFAIYTAFQDITTRKNKENLLKNQAIRDPLTSLYNRRYFEEEVGKRITEAKVNGSEYAVLMIDADHFKNVNDTYGHKTGDKVLIELASTCERALRENDIIARYGGEEFVIFLAKTDVDSAKMVADRLCETIAKVVVHADDNTPVTFTVSIGISSSDVSDNIDHLIKMADEALYRAKNNGRNRSEIFTKHDKAAFKSNEEPSSKITRHPIFDKENEQEISLLDDASSKHLN